MNESVEVFLRTLNDRFIAFKNDLDSLMRALPSNDTSEKIATANTTLQSANDIQRNLSESDRPMWLRAIISTLSHHAAHLENADHAYKLNRDIATIYEPIRQHQWQFSEAVDPVTFPTIRGRATELA